MAPPDRILLIRLKSIGDILFALPAVHLVRANFPGAHIAFMVSKENAPVLQGFAEVQDILPLDRALYRWNNLKAMCVETLALIRRLRRQKFSLVVDFQGYGETALLTWLTGAPERWGNVYRATRAWAYTRKMARRDFVHPAEGNLSLLHQCGLKPSPVLNKFVLPDTALEEARGFFTTHGLAPTRPTLFIQPFTSSPQKNWPLEKQMAVGRHWQARGVQVLFGGGPAERAALEPARQAGFPVSAGVPLLVNCGVMKLCTLVLGGDTGVMHTAVAMDKRVLMLINATTPGRPHPFQHPEWTVTPPAGQPVSATSVEAVNEGCAQALAELGAVAGPGQKQARYWSSGAEARPV